MGSQMISFTITIKLVVTWIFVEGRAWGFAIAVKTRLPGEDRLDNQPWNSDRGRLLIAKLQFFFAPIGMMGLSIHDVNRHPKESKGRNQVAKCH